MRWVFCTRATGVADFGGDHEAVAMRGNEAAENLFALTVGITIGGVKMGDAGGKAGVKHGGGGMGVSGAAELHAAKGVAADGGAVGAGDRRFHGRNVGTVLGAGKGALPLPQQAVATPGYLRPKRSLFRSRRS